MHSRNVDHCYTTVYMRRGDAHVACRLCVRCKHIHTRDSVQLQSICLQRAKFFNVSLCGNLTEPCKDSLTGKSNHKCVPLVCSFASSPSLPPSLSLSLSYNCHSKNNKNKMIGQEQPPGTVYTLFYRENKEAPGTCWDVLARWEHFVSATALATTGGDGKNGVLISFSRSGDAHISCNNVTVEVDISCDKLAPAEPKKALVTGVQTNCDWALKVRTAHSSICRPPLKIAIN